ncbi:ATP-binding protein [Streptomyces sp. CC208A]|uniref:ATP-binding protein n=1 Tax=Streptomyces sp. CC208A TaxID=3044573 RepID=UPI0024A99731|nr:ATP-binding protein [Streptomyces sp. CC208A]
MPTATQSTPLAPLTGPPGLPLHPGSHVRDAHRALCVMRATVEAVPLLRRFAREAAAPWELGDEVEEALGVAVTELVANVVRHSGSPDVAVLLTTTGTTLTLQVQDTGRWRPRRPRLPGDDDAACCGRGLQLVRAYAQDCAIIRTAHGTRVAVTLVADAVIAQRTVAD